MNIQDQFLRNEFWILSWNASVQRAVRYAKSKTEKDRRAFRQFVIEHCERVIIPRYKNGQTEAEHVANVVELRDIASSYRDQELLAKPYNIGVAQKLLNLQLKYLWCANLVEIPPHCPVDRIILGYTRLKNQVNWTTMTCVSEYEEVVEAIRATAGDTPIAIWELATYDRRRKGKANSADAKSCAAD